MCLPYTRKVLRAFFVVLLLVLSGVWLLSCLPQTKSSAMESPGVGAGFRTVALAEASADEFPEDPSGLPVYGNWKNYTQEDGLPSNKVFTVRAYGETVWLGTEKGLARFREGEWRAFGVKEGLPHPVVLSVDVSPYNGDVWIGTMGGLARFSAGRFDVFTQTSSGLSNDFVNDVQCDPEEPLVWVATAMGLSRFDLLSGTWEIYTQENTPMHEPWTYSVAVDRGLVYVGAWGAGILEYRKDQSRWREYRDPDQEMDIDLLPNDGPVHDVTAGVEFQDGVLWQATYTGLARYDGRLWSSYYREDSGLASNFVNFIRARQRQLWAATDDGLSVTDSDYWITYRAQPDGSTRMIFSKGSQQLKVESVRGSFSHNFILGLDLQGDEIWLATDAGISRGIQTSVWTPAAGGQEK